MVPQSLSLSEDIARAVEAMPSMMAWAMSWANKGIPVLPCKPDKGPYVEGGKLGATLDQDQIREWWTEWPDAMIGGRMDGLVVLDCDAYKPGHDEDMAELVTPQTLEFSTPGRDGRRGRHLVYGDPDGTYRSSKVGRNRTIDVRAGTSMDYIVLPPSLNGSGSAYRILRNATPTPAPDWLPRFDYSSPEAVPDTPAPEALPDVLPARVVYAMQSDAHDPSAHTVHVALAAAESFWTDGQIVSLLEQDLITQRRRSEKKRRSPNWWPAEVARVLAYVRTKVPEGPSTAVAGSIQESVKSLIESVSRYEYLKDETHILSALAVASTHALDDRNPAWLLLVGPSSSGKTSTVNLIGKDAYPIDAASEAGLLSWVIPNVKDAPAVPFGFLPEIAARSVHLATVADLSVLVRADRSNRSSDLWSAMRRVHDGSYYRDVNPPGGRGGGSTRLEWHGRITVVGAATNDIDDYIGNNELGPRWLYYRMPTLTDDERRIAARMAVKDGRDAQKLESRDLAAGIIARAATEIRTAPDWLIDLSIDCANVTAYGRATVRREGRHRDLAGEPAIEDPGRLTQELSTLGRGLLALGCSKQRVTHIVRKTALDSMPAMRFRVLSTLANFPTDQPMEGPTTYHVAKLSGKINWRTARVVLDDLELIGVVESWSEGNKHEIRQDDPTSVISNPEGADESDKRIMQWSLVGNVGNSVYQAIQDNRSSVLLWIHLRTVVVPCMRLPLKPPPRARFSAPRTRVRARTCGGGFLGSCIQYPPGSPPHTRPVVCACDWAIWVASWSTPMIGWVYRPRRLDRRADDGVPSERGTEDDSSGSQGRSCNESDRWRWNRQDHHPGDAGGDPGPGPRPLHRVQPGGQGRRPVPVPLEREVLHHPRHGLRDPRLPVPAADARWPRPSVEVGQDPWRL